MEGVHVQKADGLAERGKTEREMGHSFISYAHMEKRASAQSLQEWRGRWEEEKGMKGKHYLAEPS